MFPSYSHEGLGNYLLHPTTVLAADYFPQLLNRGARMHTLVLCSPLQTIALRLGFERRYSITPELPKYR